ncbi:hypothetical protein L6452_28207 [Arctium lappa]|uniref:Uncharacterized protein n=1 Tax=Arctium lappa TaxID=4217 RepID=A0ACB8ZXP2_ARCLA|nr:hypothetical protein L6452_28207 [Arctium lappa]
MKTVLFFMFSLILYSNFAFGQSAKLDDKEVKVLKELGEKLGLAGKKEWDLDKDLCSGEGSCGRGEYIKGFEVVVHCACSFERNAACHVITSDFCSSNFDESAMVISESKRNSIEFIFDLVAFFQKNM